MIIIQDSIRPTVLRKNIGLFVPYILEYIAGMYTFHYVIIKDEGQDISDDSVVKSIMDSIKII